MAQSCAIRLRLRRSEALPCPFRVLPFALAREDRMMGKLSKSLRFEILTRDGYRCRYCGATAQTTELHIDHVLPRSAGGEDDASNLVTACIDCNFGKSDRKLIGIPQGFALSRDKRPERMARMRYAKKQHASPSEHVLDCGNIDEWDEIDCDTQLVWIWCQTHKKYEWHSVPLDIVHCGSIYRTKRKPVSW